MTIEIQQITARIRSEDATVIEQVAAEIGATCAGAVSHAYHFGKQMRDGNYSSHASIRLPSGFRDRLSADTEMVDIVRALPDDLS